MEVDLFGNEIVKDELLRDKFIEPPFTRLDAVSGSWQKRKNIWKNKGIKSEVGRQKELTGLNGFNNNSNYESRQSYTGTSIFDPVLCELMYHWFCVEGGTILDPFAGGSVRGIVANYLGYNYTGIELRQEQVDSNREQGLDFKIKYGSIIKKSCDKLKKNGYAVFVVGDVRDKKTGFYKDFVTITKQCFYNAGMGLYNEAILLENGLNTAAMRADNYMKNKKLVKVHQNVLIFKKP
jgi:hypothetical protein